LDEARGVPVHAKKVYGAVEEKKNNMPIPEIQPPNCPTSRLVTIPTISLQFCFLTADRKAK